VGDAPLEMTREDATVGMTWEADAVPVMNRGGRGRRPQDDNRGFQYDSIPLWELTFFYSSSILLVRTEIIMTDVETTRMSSKGQVVIPENIRNKLGLKAGSQFIVVGEKDVVILKSIGVPLLAEFNRLINKARKQAEKAGLKESDISSLINEARNKK
jgi:AbrB family looped-hinge helix DNA binding protein